MKFHIQWGEIPTVDIRYISYPCLKTQHNRQYDRDRHTNIRYISRIIHGEVRDHEADSFEGLKRDAFAFMENSELMPDHSQYKGAHAQWSRWSSPFTSYPTRDDDIVSYYRYNAILLNSGCESKPIAGATWEYGQTSGYDIRQPKVRGFIRVEWEGGSVWEGRYYGTDAEKEREWKAYCKYYQERWDARVADDNKKWDTL